MSPMLDVMAAKSAIMAEGIDCNVFARFQTSGNIFRTPYRAPM